MMTSRWNKMVLLLSGLSWLLAACAGMEVRSNAQSAYEQGLTLFNQGQHSEAIPHFAKATELDAEFVQAYLYLGRSYLNLSRWREAISPLRTALRLSPDDAKKEVTGLLLDALFGLATSTFQSGQYQESITALKDVLNLAPRSGRATSQLVTTLLAFGGQLLSRGDFSQAINAYTEVTQLTPRSTEAYVGLARSFFQRGDFAKALGATTEAMRLSPNSRDALSLLLQLQRR